MEIVNEVFNRNVETKNENCSFIYTYLYTKCVKISGVWQIYNLIN
jgi:hypothetical protein